MAEWVWEAGGYGGDDEVVEDDDNNSEAIKAVPGKDALIFLVDCSSGMSKPYDKKDSFIQKALKAIIGSLHEKLIKQSSDLVGVAFYGTRCSKGNDHENVYVLRDLDSPDVPLVQQLESLEKDEKLLESTIGTSDDCKLGNAFWACNAMISNCSKKLADRRIILITNTDNPFQGKDNAGRKFAITKAKDVRDSKDVGIEVVPLTTPGQRFDSSAFFTEITEKASISISDSGDFESLITSVRCRVHRERPQMIIPFKMFNDFEIGVRLYGITKIATKGTPKNLYNVDNSFVESKRRYVCVESQRPLRFEDIKKGFVYGGEQVVFDKEETAKMKYFDEPGLVLMGFKPLERLKRQYNIKSPSIVYPDEHVVNGSTTVFVALHNALKNQGKCAICRLIGRRGAEPRFVGLEPVEQGDDKLLCLVYLPYHDDIRKPVYERENPTSNEEQITSVRAVISNLKSSKFSARAIKNPALQSHYHNLEALAFSRDQVADWTDDTIVTDNEIAKEAEHEINSCVNALFPSDYNAFGKQKAAPKRKLKAEDGDGPAKKKAKTVGVDEVRELFEADKLKSLTVPTLKDFLSSVDVKPKGKKGDLIQQVEIYFGTLGEAPNNEDAGGGEAGELQPSTDQGPLLFHHSKDGGVFWSIEQQGEKTISTWGAIGAESEASSSEKVHKDVPTADKFVSKKITEKTKKGYEQQ